MMQKKKNLPEEQASNWQDTLKKEQQKQIFKKIAIWGIIGFACLAGLAGLVKLAQTTGPSTTPVVSEKLPEVTDKDIILGNKKAKVTIIEYSDFQCPACASYNPIINRILSDYDGQVRVVYRFFPLTNIHKNAVISGQAGYAAFKLGKFTDMKDLLFDNQKSWELLADPREVFEGYASSIGLEVIAFRKIMNSDEAKNAVMSGEREAASIGINSTPSFFLGKLLINANGFDSFKEQIDKELEIQKPLQ